jgi:pyridoxamine 5'-phosphate oxidase
MDFNDCIQFANEHPICYLATMDGDQPRVRTQLLWFADQSGFYFATLSPKDMSKQMKKNPKIELCFYNSPSDINQSRQMRIVGEVEFVEDEALLDRILKERKFLADIVGRPLDDVTEVFRITSGEAHFWTFADILKEKQLERLNF